MRLLNVEDLSFTDFQDENDIPPYAIGSHCWIGDETTYLAFSEKTDTSSKGHQKIKSFCDFVKWRNELLKARKTNKRQIQWIWIDTCCIDKRHSAEVNENITSMFQYYENAEECYAFLHDVDSNTRPSETLSQFESSKWFTRGWTLQELLAPSKVFFLSSTWTILGHKCTAREGKECHCALDATASGRRRLNEYLAKITGIPPAILSKKQAVSSLPPQAVCQWALSRVTRKSEDSAYCLLGLFGISMVPNYGERLFAWTRLVRKVAKKYNLKEPLLCPANATLRNSASTTQEAEVVCGVDTTPQLPHVHTDDQQNYADREALRVIEKHIEADARLGYEPEVSLSEIQKLFQCTRLDSKAKTWEEMKQELDNLEREICDGDRAQQHGFAADLVAGVGAGFAHSKSHRRSENKKDLGSIASRPQPVNNSESAGILLKKHIESSRVNETPLQTWLKCREDNLYYRLSYGGRNVRKKACNAQNSGVPTDEDSASSSCSTASVHSEASLVVTPVESQTSVASSVRDYTPKGESENR